MTTGLKYIKLLVEDIHSTTVATIGTDGHPQTRIIDMMYYLFDYYDEVLKDIGVVTNIDFSLRNRNLQDIKKILALTKKSQFSQQLSETIYAPNLVDMTRLQVRISIPLKP